MGRIGDPLRKETIAPDVEPVPSPVEFPDEPAPQEPVPDREREPAPT